jgi:hypothetical protein
MYKVSYNFSPPWYLPPPLSSSSTKPRGSLFEAESPPPPTSVQAPRSHGLLSEALGRPPPLPPPGQGLVIFLHR